MSGIETSWATPAVQAIAWALIHFLWQGALVGLAAAGVLGLLRRGSAAQRYAVAAAALLLMLALPVGTALLSAGSLDATSGLVPSTAGKGANLPISRIEAPSMPAVLPAPIQDALPSALPWIFALWLAGVALLSMYHLGGWRQVRKLRKAGRPLGGDLEATVRSLAGRLGVARAIRLLESSAVPVPAVIGWLRPAILVPASTLAGLTPRQLEAVLAHELAHIRRHDYLVNLLQTVVETLLFYHPAVWWVSSQVRRERESCCDDLAVAVCGDRLGYARALAELEGLRAPSPRLAMAADGASLLDRIRRLVGAPARRSPRSWMAGVLALSLLPMGLSFNYVRGSVDRDDTGSFSGDIEIGNTEAGDTADRADGHRGTWTAERRGDRIQLEMSMSWDGGRHRWMNGETYAAKDFSGLTAGPDVRFDLRRDAGTFHFEGRFKGDDGTGFFTFQGNPGYIRDMAALGIQMKEDRLLEAATHDISLAFAREIHDVGYRDASLDTLVQFRIHGVNPQIIRELSGLGYQHLPADEIVQFQIHGVSPALLRELARAGYQGIPPDQVVQFQIHGVSPEYVRGMAENGYRNVAPDDLVQFRIHGVSPELVHGLAEAGYRNVPADQLVQFRIHGVDGAFAREAVRRYGKLAPDQLVELKIRGRLD
jgi:beta-lactamase regulating signal transducer with metallopeptidase domain